MYDIVIDRVVLEYWMDGILSIEYWMGMVCVYVFLLSFVKSIGVD